MTDLLAAVINPKHYQSVLVIPAHRIKEFLDEEGNLSLQYIHCMEFMMTPEEFRGHLKGQAWKYLLRLGKKDEAAQEVSKSIWYLEALKKWFGNAKSKQ